MVEETETCHGHGNPVLIAGIDNMVIANGTACLGNVIYPAAMSPFDIVTERKERITTERYAVQFP